MECEFSNGFAGISEELPSEETGCDFFCSAMGDEGGKTTIRDPGVLRVGGRLPRNQGLLRAFEYGGFVGADIGPSLLAYRGHGGDETARPQHDERAQYDGRHSRARVHSVQ